jgi:hypothetical protein
MSKILIGALVVMAVTYHSCEKAPHLKAPYVVDKPSPQGTYRIKIELTPNPQRGSGIYERNEHLKIQYFKGQEIIATYETDSSDDLEVPLGEGLQVVEWVAENAVRLGRDRSQQPFSDELSISNQTGEPISFLQVGYGRFESFRIFDLPAGSSITLAASPEFKPDGTSNHSLVYSGYIHGRVIEGDLNHNQRTSPAEGPLRFPISIDSTSFRK